MLATSRREEKCGEHEEYVRFNSRTRVIPEGIISLLDLETGLCHQNYSHRLMRDTGVTGISIDARGVSGVETSRGFVSGRTVVNAAGAWAGRVARLAGVDLPVEPLRRMLVPTEPFDKVSHQSPRWSI